MAYGDYTLYEQKSKSQNELLQFGRENRVWIKYGVIGQTPRIRVTFSTTIRSGGASSATSDTGQKGETIYETGKVSSELSDAVSKDLKRRGMKFVGTAIVYSYLQAVGVINSHEESCFCRQPNAFTL